jgi:hypothetical protein
LIKTNALTKFKSNLQNELNRNQETQGRSARHQGNIHVQVALNVLQDTKKRARLSHKVIRHDGEAAFVESLDQGQTWIAYVPDLFSGQESKELLDKMLKEVANATLTI